MLSPFTNLPGPEIRERNTPPPLATSHERILEAVESINAALQQMLDVKALAKLALHQMIEALDPDHARGLVGTLEWMDEGASELPDLYGVGYNPYRQSLLPNQALITEHILPGGDSPRDAEAGSERSDVASTEPAIRSTLTVPLTRAGQVAGVLALTAPAPNQFGAEDTRLVQTVALQISIALDHAHARAQSEETGAELKKEQVRRMTAEQGLVWAQAAQGLAHHIGSNLGIVSYWVSEIKDLLSDYYRADPERVTEIYDCLAQIESSTDLVLQLSLGLEDYFASRPEALHPIHVAEAFSTARESVPLPASINLDLSQLSDTIMTRANTFLAGAFAELIRNAIKAMPEGGTLEVGSQERTDGYVEVWFKDNGKGIAATDLDKIFGLFYRGGDHAVTRGFGLGLPFVRFVVRSFNGEITVKSDGPGQGATFLVYLPIYQEPVSAA